MEERTKAHANHSKSNFTVKMGEVSFYYQIYGICLITPSFVTIILPHCVPQAFVRNRTIIGSVRGQPKNIQIDPQ